MRTQVAFNLRLQAVGGTTGGGATDEFAVLLCCVRCRVQLGIQLLIG